MKKIINFLKNNCLLASAKLMLPYINISHRSAVNKANISRHVGASLQIYRLMSHSAVKGSSAEGETGEETACLKQVGWLNEKLCFPRYSMLIELISICKIQSQPKSKGYITGFTSVSFPSAD